MLWVGSAPGLQSHGQVVCPQSLLCTGVVGSGRSGCNKRAKEKLICRETCAACQGDLDVYLLMDPVEPTGSLQLTRNLSC